MTTQAGTQGAERQTTNTVMMVRPSHFFANPDSMATNAFQAAARELDPAALLARARAEFDAFVSVLRRHGVVVIVAEDSPEPAKPDAVFPNNWFSTHADGTLVLYPMQVVNRRSEVRPELLDALSAKARLVIRRVIDLRDGLSHSAFLEGTGSMVLDRPRRIAYACLSARTTREGLERFAAELGYRVRAFRATDAKGRPIYHTNVLMCLGERFALACLEALPDGGERAELRASLGNGGRQLIEITLDQLERFAGNCLELCTQQGDAIIVLSARALDALRPDQRQRLSAFGTLVPVELTTIETYGGGSARCMLAELFLPPA